ncbi:hypothetical protein E2C01_080612 [Portunus trituberculatus]|uniref:Uncharacterized protein n=1 Tax=Portunus trituberculatus TaxID=210409 RepID=A0A5B7ITP9_PORTR|nr:hypothetical protein [Portunus trituberculatus]
MRALGFEGSPSARVRNLSMVQVLTPRTSHLLAAVVKGKVLSVEVSLPACLSVFLIMYLAPL